MIELTSDKRVPEIQRAAACDVKWVHLKQIREERLRAMSEGSRVHDMRETVRRIESSSSSRPTLRFTGLIVEEATPAATASPWAHYILVLLLHPLQLLHPLELPTNLPLIFLVFKVEHGPDEILVALDPIPTSLGPNPTRRCAR